MADTAFLDLQHVRRSGRRAVLATIVRGTGSTYRRPGTSAVICENGEVLGAISGGCLESDIREAALQVIAGAPPRLLHYNTASPDDLIFGTGSGCGGLIQVLVAPLSDDLLAVISQRMDAGQPVGLETVIAPGPLLGARKIAAAKESFSYADQGQVFCQLIDPPVTLLVCGAGDDARPLVTYAAEAGFRVIVMDHRPAWVTPERFPAAHQTLLCDMGAPPSQLSLAEGSFAVLLTHHYERDLEHLKVLLDRPLAYVGLLGSRERSGNLIRELLTERPDLSSAVKEKLYAPVGLDIGADGPHEIALAKPPNWWRGGRGARARPCG
jgi:xanthine/CO dehydrogenase XdhC/CoxF family maturation factor